MEQEVKKRGNPNFGKREQMFSGASQAIKAPEVKLEDTNLDLGIEIDPTKTYVFEVINKSSLNRYETLGSQAKAFEPHEKRYVYLRYFPTVNSIFQDEQDESWDNEFPPPLIFSRNQIEVPGENRRLMEYMMLHPLREGSPYALQGKPAKFRIRDKDIEEKIMAKRHETELNALKTLDNTHMDDLRPIARVLFGITEESDMAIKNKMVEMVKTPKTPKQPKSFAELVLENIGNNKLLHEYYIQLGFDRGIIVADFGTMQVKWTETGAVITNMNSRNRLKDVTDYSFTKDGEVFYSELKRKLSF